MTNTLDSQVSRIQLTADLNGIRIDKYLAENLPQFSRTQIKKLLHEGFITINNVFAKASHKLNYNDIIRIEIQPTQNLQAEPLQLNVIYEDEDVLVIDKPAGLVVHPGPGHPDHTLVNAILDYCPEICTDNDLVRPGIVHRLDKDTSGLIVIAKNVQVKENLINQFKKHHVVKHYLVLVKGRLFPDNGIIDATIGRDPYNFKRMAIVTNGKEAVTYYTVSRRFSDYTLLDVIPKTGRTHQIRVHLSAIGHAVAGDLVYGQVSAHINRQFIHSKRLGFHLPSTGIYHDFCCPTPFDLEEVLKVLDDNI